ncbi:hypothetical protein ZIOFF_032449 [Zingiber officinale]|uniref:Uncharacterized protein n=1 Tax=Zingiber officinale TaxID=94328 RepID=A0A8J5GNL4_ZINOF|nr:hypothetical protein ZIOFF_032449 [Zingiber officinale]
MPHKSSAALVPSADGRSDHQWWHHRRRRAGGSHLAVACSSPSCGFTRQARGALCILGPSLVIQGDQCSVRYNIDVQYTGSIEDTQSSATSSVEEPSCPVCLERLDQILVAFSQQFAIILFTVHAYLNGQIHLACSYGNCISTITDLIRRLCTRFYILLCGIKEELIKEELIKEELPCFHRHAFKILSRFADIANNNLKHQHALSVELLRMFGSVLFVLETQRVWDYVGDNYVHRLIQSKTDGKLVELNFHSAHADDKRGSCECSEDLGFDEALLNSKLDIMAGEYNDLLTSQLDNQRKYYESLVLEIKEETEKDISEAIKKAVSLKLQKFQIKLDKCIEEKKFMEDLHFASSFKINENLLKNEDTWKAKVQHLVNFLLGDLIMHIESQKVIDEPPKDSVASEIKGGTVLPIEPSSSSCEKNRRRN